MLDQRKELVEHDELHFEFDCVHEWMNCHLQREHVIPVDGDQGNVEEHSEDLSSDEQLHNSMRLVSVSILEKFACIVDIEQ